MVILFSLLTSAVAVMAVPLVAETRSTGPDPSQVYINSVEYGGTGCPENTVESALSSDRQSLSVVFNQFGAIIGHDMTSARENCVLLIDMSYPSGFQYSVFTTNFRGYAALDNVTTGYQKSTFYFGGQTEDAAFQANFLGPVTGNYQVTVNVSIESIVWSACSENDILNIASEVAVFGSKGGRLTEDTQNEQVTHVASFQWRKCP